VTSPAQPASTKTLLDRTGRLWSWNPTLPRRPGEQPGVFCHRRQRRTERELENEAEPIIEVHDPRLLTVHLEPIPADQIRLYDLVVLPGLGGLSPVIGIRPCTDRHTHICSTCAPTTATGCTGARTARCCGPTSDHRAVPQATPLARTSPLGNPVPEPRVAALRWRGSRTMDDILAVTLSRAVHDRLDYLDELATKSDLESRAAPAHTEIVRLTFWRILLAAHQPDERGRCPERSRCRRPRHHPCSVGTVAGQHLIASDLRRPRAPPAGIRLPPAGRRGTG
jgi:hypothetical protein